MEDLLKLIPGMANNPALNNIKVDEKKIARKRAIVSSMTPAERETFFILPAAFADPLRYVLLQAFRCVRNANSKQYTDASVQNSGK